MTTYLWIVQCRYPGPHGWEDVYESAQHDDALARYREYQRNDFYALAVRIIRRLA